MPAQVPVRSADPSSDLLNLDEVKEHLRVDGPDEDTFIAALINAAVAFVDGYVGILGRALLEQGWTWSLEGFPACERCLRLPLGDLLGDPSVSYYDASGALQTFSGFTAVQDVMGPVLVLDGGESWPITAIRPDAVTVTWTCGFGAAADVPDDILLALKMIVAHWYANREAASASAFEDIPFGSRMLLERYRKIGI